MVGKGVAAGVGPGGGRSSRSSAGRCCLRRRRWCGGWRWSRSRRRARHSWSAIGWGGLPGAGAGFSWGWSTSRALSLSCVYGRVATVSASRGHGLRDRNVFTLFVTLPRDAAHRCGGQACAGDDGGHPAAAWRSLPARLTLSRAQRVRRARHRAAYTPFPVGGTKPRRIHARVRRDRRPPAAAAACVSLGGGRGCFSFACSSLVTGRPSRDGTLRRHSRRDNCDAVVPCGAPAKNNGDGFEA